MTYAIGLIITVMSLMVGIGSNIEVFLLGGAIIIVIGAALGATLMTSGGGLRDGVGAIFRRDADLTHLRQGVRILRSFRTGALVGGFLTMSFGFVRIMRFVDVPEQATAGMVMTSMGLFWALVIGYGGALPLETRLQCRLLERGIVTQFSEVGRDLLVFSTGFGFAGIFLAYSSYQF